MAKFPLRLGVIGPGIIWKKMHSKSLAARPDMVAIAAFCATRQSTRDAAAAAYPGARLYRDYLGLLADDAIDAVLVTTPIRINAEVALAALSAGKIVFVEKPMAASIPEAEALVRASRPNGTPRLYVLEQYDYADVWAKIRAEIADGAIGRLVCYDRFTSVRLAPGADPSGYGANEWRRGGDFPLGPLFDGGIHDIALLANVFGTPQAVFADGVRLREEHGEYDLVQVSFRYESGLLGTLTHSGILPAQRNYFHIRGDGGMIDCGWSKTVVEPASGDRESRTLTTSGRPWQDLMWETILQCVATEIDAPYTPENAQRDIATLFAIRESLTSRRAVQVDFRQAG